MLFAKPWEWASPNRSHELAGVALLAVAHRTPLLDAARMNSLSPAAAPSRASLFVLAACSAFVLAWFAAFQGTASFGMDESITMTQLDRDFRGMLGAVKRDTGPPGWFFGMWLWWHVGAPAEWSMRLPSILAAAAVPFPLFLAFRRLVSDRTALLAVAMTAVGPFFVRYAPEMRFYAVLQLLVALSTLAMLRLEEVLDAPREDRRWIGRGLWWAALGAFVLYAHTLAAFYLWAQGLYLLARRGTRGIGRWLPFLALSGLLFAPWVPFAANQGAMPQLSWIADRIGGQIGLPLVAQMVVEFVSGMADPGGDFLKHAPPAFVLAPLAIVGLAGFARRDRRASLALAMLLLPTALLLAASYVRPYFVTRYLIPSLPFFFLAVAAGIERIPRPPLRATVAALCLATLLAATWRNRHSWPTDDWRTAARAMIAVERAEGSGEIVVLGDRWEHFRITEVHVAREIAASHAGLVPRHIPMPDKSRTLKFVADPPARFWYCAAVGSLDRGLDRLAEAGHTYVPVEAIQSGGQDRRCFYWLLVRVE